MFQQKFYCSFFLSYPLPIALYITFSPNSSLFDAINLQLFSYLFARI
jgi:hypothetical protein